MGDVLNFQASRGAGSVHAMLGRAVTIRELLRAGDTQGAMRAHLRSLHGREPTEEECQRFIRMCVSMMLQQQTSDVLHLHGYVRVGSTPEGGERWEPVSSGPEPASLSDGFLEAGGVKLDGASANHDGVPDVSA